MIHDRECVNTFCKKKEQKKKERRKKKKTQEKENKKEIKVSFVKVIL